MRLRFNSKPGHCQVTILGKLFTHMPLFTKLYNSVPVKGRRCSAAKKVTVSLALHWPCVTDSVVYPPTGSTANVWEMSTPPMLLIGHGLVCLFYQKYDSKTLNTTTLNILFETNYKLAEPTTDSYRKSTIIYH